MKRQSSLVIFHVETRFGKDGRPYTVKLTTHSNKGRDYHESKKPSPGDGTQASVGNTGNDPQATEGWQVEQQQLGTLGQTVPPSGEAL